MSQIEIPLALRPLGQKIAVFRDVLNSMQTQVRVLGDYFKVLEQEYAMSVQKMAELERVTTEEPKEEIVQKNLEESTEPT